MTYRSLLLLVSLGCTGAAFAQSHALSPTELFRQASPSVVVVKVYDKRDKLLAFGSGVVIADGVVATNCHVLNTKGAQYPEVEDRGKNLSADLREVDKERDLCTLDVGALSAKSVTMGSSKSLEIGDKVYAIGAPEGYKLSLSDGLVSGKRGIGGVQLLQVTAPISHGSSGGGLFDSSGRLVGITTLTDASGQSLNFAIPAEWIADLPKRSTYSAKRTAADIAAEQADREATAASDARAAAVHVDAEYQARLAQAASDAIAAQDSADAAAAAADAVAAEESKYRSQGRWQVISKDDDLELEVDTKSVQRIGRNVDIWTSFKYSKPRQIGSSKKFVREVRLMTAHCGTRKISFGSGMRYDFNGDVVGSYEPKSYEIKPSNVVPDTNGESIYEKACAL